MLKISEIESQIISQTFIKEVYHFETISSTNSFCKTLDNKNDVLVTACYQSNGKGRYERSWESQSNKNLLFTIKKKIKLRFNNLFYINFYFSYFILSGIINFLIDSKVIFNKDYFQIKWPNDLLYQSKKFSGLLVESNVIRNEHIIGAGINVNQLEFNNDNSPNVTSLKKITNEELNLNKLLLSILINISQNINLLEDNPVKIYKLWKSKCNMINKPVKYRDIHNFEKFAQVIDINQDGSIKLEIDGQINNYYAGEIKILTN